MSRRVLVVEDEEPLCRLVARNLTARGNEVTTANTAEAALAQLAARDFDLMLLDIDLPDRTGWEVVRELRATGRDVPFVVVSAVRINPERLVEFRPIAYLPKPFPLDALLRIVAEGSAAGSDALEPDEAARSATGAPSADASDVQSTLEEYDRRVEQSRRSETMPELLRSEFEQRFAELAAHVIVPAMNAVESQLVDHGHRTELVEEQHPEGPPAWSHGALITLSVLPGGWDLTGARHRLRPRISFVGNAERGAVEIHGWIAKPSGRGAGRLRATLALAELTRARVDHELRTFLDEVFASEIT